MQLDSLCPTITPMGRRCDRRSQPRSHPRWKGVRRLGTIEQRVFASPGVFARMNPTNLAHDPDGMPDRPRARPLLSATTIIQTDFRSDPSIVLRIRRHIAGLYAEIGRDDDLGERLSMVVYELLENVAKYGASQQGRLEIRLDSYGSQAELHVRTRNVVPPERLVRLRQVLEAMSARRDATGLYDDVIARRAAADDGESGLGLARVRAEGQMHISYAVDGESVTIDAEWSGKSSRSPWGTSC